MTAITEASARKAALAVAERATSADDCRELLSMLGLASPTTRRRGRPTVDHGHGDYRTYIKGCRCDDCREGHRIHTAEIRKQRFQDPKAADRAGHGKASTYKNYGCRCEACSKANTADVNVFRAKRRARAELAGVGGAS